MLYLIDTNILLFPYKVSNPLDFHPTFWSKMKLILERDDVFSIDKVKDEIYYQDDELSNWCKLNITRKFWKSTNSSLEQYADIQNWAQNQNYNERALLQFAELNNADPFLLAFAVNYKINNIGIGV